MGNGSHHRRRIVLREERASQAQLRRYKPAQNLWETSRARELTLRETLDIYRQCHKLAPFCCYNGNTFVAIGRTMIQDLLKRMSPLKAHGFRSVVGHYIAGTAGADALAKALDELD